MKVGKMDFGFWKTKQTFKEMLWFEYLLGACGCKFISIKKFVLTYYSNECYKELKEKDNGITQKKRIKKS